MKFSHWGEFLETSLEKKGLVKKLLLKGIFISPEELERIDENKLNIINNKINLGEPIDIKSILSEQNLITENTNQTTNKGKTKILFNYDREPKLRDVTDFINHFNARYKSLKKILEGKLELKNTTSISKVLRRQETEQVSVIGLVYEKSLSQKGNILITLEDPTDSITVVINKNKTELFNEAQDLVYDEVIGVIGQSGNRVIFADKIIHPDVPITNGLKKSPDEAYAVFTSDIHVGTKLFLKDDFEKFIAWLNCEAGTTEQKDIARKVKYLFIAGDLVEGVGVFPGQEKYLEITDISKQYEKLAEYLSRIRKDIDIIIIPGNHDALRLSEPQPPVDSGFAKPLKDIENIIFASNPSLVNIHSSGSFPGFDVLLYHGASFHYYANNVDSIRLAGGIKRADLIMKFLLKRRHLAPSHQSNLYIPDPDKDYLVIEKVPDFFVTGDIHRVTALNYKNITLINSSTWSRESENQVKMGIEPQTSRAIVVNLHTRGIKIMRFSSEQE